MKVAAKLVLVDKSNRVLMIREAVYEGGRNPGKWDIPGGTHNEGETVRDGLIREVKEEIGVDVSQLLHKYPIEHCVMTSTVEDNRIRLFIYRRVPMHFDTSIKLSGDHDSFAWMDISQVDEDKLMPGLWGVLDVMI